MRILVGRIENDGVMAFGKVSILDFILCKFTKKEKLIKLKPLWRDTNNRPMFFYKDWEEVHTHVMNVSFNFLNQDEIDRLFFLTLKKFILDK